MAIGGTVLNTMRRVHRVLAVFAVVIGLYVAATGTFLQMIDLSTLLSHAPASNPNLRAIRDGRNGPPNFAVATDADAGAKTLPEPFDYATALSRVVTVARGLARGADIRFVEFRMGGDRPIAQVRIGGRLLRVDAGTGALLADMGDKVGAKGPRPPQALRNQVKNIHRMLAYGDVGVVAFFLMSLLLCAMTATGLVLYYRLWRGRSRLRRTNPFWVAGGWWRSLHRATSCVAGLFLVVVVVSGTLLAFNDLAVSAYGIANGGKRPGLTSDASAPLSDAQLHAMLGTTLAAFRSADPDSSIRVLRLRSFAGMPQGVLVTGGADARQVAFDARTGRPASLSGPGYPYTGQPFGWQFDQFMKGIHRGDAIGLPGRWMSLFAGLSLLFLSVSGATMYGEMWSRRRRGGRTGLFWR